MLEEDAQMKLRLTHELKEEIEHRAKLNRRTMNGEIVNVLEREFNLNDCKFYVHERIFKGNSSISCITQINEFIDQYLGNGEVINIQFADIKTSDDTYYEYSLFYKSKRKPRSRKSLIDAAG